MPQSSTIDQYTSVLPVRHNIRAYSKNTGAMWHFEAELSKTRGFSSIIQSWDSRDSQSGILVPDSSDTSRTSLQEIPSNGVNAYWAEEQNDHGDYETNPKAYAELPVFFTVNYSLRIGNSYFNPSTHHRF